MSMYDINIKRIKQRTEAGLDMLRENYRVNEIDTGSLQRFKVDGRVHAVKQYDIEGVGNLVIMTNPEPGRMQMDTFMITPYYKNLPLFTTDYMYFEDSIMMLNEIYDLVEEKDDLYNSYIERFRENCSMVSYMKDMPMRECWYDSIRPVFAGKITGPDQFDTLFELFIKNLDTFIEMEKSLPLLPDEKRQGKWSANFEYARALVEDGGVSTDLFVRSLGEDETKRFFYSVFFAPYRYRPGTNDRLESFFDQMDENGIANAEKLKKKQQILQRLPETDRNKSTEISAAAEHSDGIVVEDGKTIGFGIHILNEDVYPLQYFRIFLRSCELTGSLDLDGMKDMVFLDIYHNRISSVRTGLMPAMRIFGVQDNRLEQIDPRQMPMCQGIDAGMNLLKSIDVSENPELVELYINDNDITEIDLSKNRKLKYFYCHNNRMTSLDTRNNPLLRHLNAVGNPMKAIISLAPQRESRLPLELRAEGSGCVGLRFDPVYDAQWKETGEWRQTYFAYPEDGHVFKFWKDENGNAVSFEKEWNDTYGSSRILTAVFE